ncbi:hypothetical protein FOMPIDRAFT_1023594 [Fomitopsis schrenkii]|uniref:Uncharacterized protein n=1 Tax=Fomitopsis schrenkii TaxID=2126942 RepID=S8FHG8_FOMSC|nr:hypothetical protein FOMPIDRAFT_1023594 [Fomitopsis schrenkii]
MLLCSVYVLGWLAVILCVFARLEGMTICMVGKDSLRITCHMYLLMFIPFSGPFVSSRAVLH